MDVSLENPKKSPPRLLVAKHQGNDLQGYILADSLYVECPAQSVVDFIIFMLACYYAWDLAYPKQYQILEFFQIYLLQDLKKCVQKCNNMIKFEKLYKDGNINN